MRMAGQMGNNRVKRNKPPGNESFPDKNLLVVKGAVPELRIHM